LSCATGILYTFFEKCQVFFRKKFGFFDFFIFSFNILIKDGIPPRFFTFEFLKTQKRFEKNIFFKKSS